MTENETRLLLLWLIRDKQPISWNELKELSLDDFPKSFQVEAKRKQHILRSAHHYIRDLLDMGLVTFTDAEVAAQVTPWYFPDQASLVMTPAFTKIRDLFGVSITQLLQGDGHNLSVKPMFGEPLSGHARAWAQIFVAMPFLDTLRPVFADHIKKVTDELGLTCKRGDDFFTANRIMDDVWSAIYHAELCIVDCTERNPNVFYELGIAHTLGRKAVLIAQTIDDIPFDVRDRRVIVYDYTPPGMQEFEEKLKKTLQAEFGLLTY